MTDPDRQRQFDAQLARVLATRRDVRLDGCPDAEALSAFLDGTLDPGARAACEMHVADCLRCQAVLALTVRAAEGSEDLVDATRGREAAVAPAAEVVRSAKVLPMAARPHWRRLAWIAPVGLAASVLLAVWIARSPSEQPALSETPPSKAVADAGKAGQPGAPAALEAPAPATAPAAGQVAMRAEPPAERQPEFSEPRPRQGAGKREAPSATAASGEVGAPTGPAPAAQAPVVAGGVPGGVVGGVVGGLPGAPAPPPAPTEREPLPPPSPAPRAAAAPARVAASPPAPGPAAQPATPPAFAAADVAEERSRAKAVAAPTAVAESARSANVLGATAGSGEFSSPSGRVSWSLQRNGIVRKATDDATAQTTPTRDSLRAGAAISDTVAWAVGARGAVWRTVNGRSWNKLPAPVPDDLVAVVAISAESAVVATADGARLRTDDGGQTWVRGER